MLSRKLGIALDWLLKLVLPPDIVQLPVLPDEGTAPTQAATSQEYAHAR